MLALAAGEGLRRKYPCSVRGSGPGTMYVTDRRVALEPRGGVPATDVPLGSLMDWRKKGRRTIALRWRDGAGRLLSADVRMGSRGGEACDPEEARMALFAAHTEAHPYGEAGMGFYRDERGNFLSRFGLGYTEGWEPGDDPDLANAAMYAHYESHQHDLLCLMTALAGGELDDFDPADPGYIGAMEGFVLRNGGRTLVEQELFRRHALLAAHEADGRYDWHGLATPEQAARDAGAAALAEEQRARVRTLEGTIGRVGAEIEGRRRAGDARWLGRIIGPGRRQDGHTHCFRGGTEEDRLAYYREMLAVARRKLEIIPAAGFESPRQRRDWDRDVENALGARAAAGGDVSGYEPSVRLTAPALPEAERRIAAFRGRLEEDAGGGAPRPDGELFVTRQLHRLFDPRYHEGATY